MYVLGVLMLVDPLKLSQISYLVVLCFITFLQVSMKSFKDVENAANISFVCLSHLLTITVTQVVCISTKLNGEGEVSWLEVTAIYHYYYYY